MFLFANQPNFENYHQTVATLKPGCDKASKPSLDNGGTKTGRLKMSHVTWSVTCDIWQSVTKE